ncbi:shikimate dehydrogenase [Vespertiliibacter pulmonis]|uniref:Shikimate dehydrogenase (NADP(+)) n=1 Tax=Vespertiliibacter pulmonis TaxID=1443036 RepID=A0A3N4VTH2_9PAST|nr:shikimate dehydrogenase [Vespertiliibacter pulmonis]QLB20408.1 shikimate dehydrogenase [Vespertiliibacter pulmonis]RPE86396.1 shikimate dehydrogenase [Vespertiliibacter pulmonis]
MNHYAVWGNPIAQSKSPQIHQLFAQQAQKQICYQRKLTDEWLFEQHLLAFFENGAKGANITAPFKEKAFALADIHSEHCLQAEACNTLKRLDDGRLYADNTDGLGLISDLTRLGWLKPHQNILILGAGGATKGVLAHLLHSKQQITLYNRTHKKAVSLANKFAKLGKVDAKCFNELSQQPFDLVINATSLGLQGKYIELPQTILCNANIYDMQYAPHMQTPFLNYAHSQGAKACQDGLGMLVGQASYAFELWEGILPEISPVLAQLKSEMES